MRALGVKLTLLAVVAGAVSACRFEGEGSSVVINGQLPIAYVKRPLEAVGDPVDSISFAPGGDLYLRDLSSPSAPETNITGRLTLGVGDVTDPEVAYDGRTIIFAMRCGAESAPACASDTTWNIWEYDVDAGSLSRVIGDDYIANLGDDVDPAYLPDGRIVFSSNRQEKTRGKLGYAYLEGLKDTPATVLHTMNGDGTDIEQISFNQSHDRNPTVLANGRIMYARWDHTAERNQVSIYTVRPDGTDMFVLYGAHSPGESFLHPRELPSGKVISTVMPLTGTREGGALLSLDVRNYADVDAAAPNAPPEGAQKPATLHNIPLDRRLSEYGRFSAPYPLWDGSNRVLVSFTPHQPGVAPDPLTGEEIAGEGEPLYGIYILDLDDKSLSPLVLPQAGIAHVDPVAILPRPAPKILGTYYPEETRPFLAQAESGLLNVKSVYDTDKLGRMGNGVLTTSERATKAIPQIEPLDPGIETRNLVADIAKLKDPARSRADQRAARFVRVTEAVPRPPDFKSTVIGRTPFSMQRILGYAPVEPDGSFMVRVPADTPISVAVLDAKARAYETPSNWLQVRPGETLVCAGCHSPRRVRALNVAPIAGNHLNTLLKDAVTLQPLNDPVTGAPVLARDGETMAETRSRVDDAVLSLREDIRFVDVWTDPGTAGRPPDATIDIAYRDLTTPAPVNGVINYLEHIQPLWDKSRPAGGAVDYRCSGCHNGFRDDVDNPTGLDLRGTAIGSTGRPVSYEDLLIGDLIFNEDGRPYYDMVDGLPVLRRKSPLATPGSARRSYLVEKLFNEELFAEQGLPAGALDHSAMLNDAEKRLIVEWIDVGAQFVNDPFADESILRGTPPTLSSGFFLNPVRGVLAKRCAVCHRPILIDGTLNQYFEPSQYIITGDPDVDFQNTAAMVTDLQNPANSFLLSRPTSTVNHPAVNGGPVLSLANAADRDDYNTLYLWIDMAQ